MFGCGVGAVLIRDIGRKKILWVISGVLALGAASFGVLNQGIYDSIVDPKYLSGTVAQDLMVLVASLVLVILSLRVKEEDTRQHLVILGILGFYFYAYGIVIIERFFNMFYLVYMAIFGLSFYGIVYTVASFDGDTFSGVSLSDGVKKFVSGYMVFSALMFSIIWISSIIPLMQTGTKPEFAWS